MQQIQLSGLQGLTVDAILPLLVDPEHTDVLVRDEWHHNVVRFQQPGFSHSFSKPVTFLLCAGQTLTSSTDAAL